MAVQILGLEEILTGLTPRLLSWLIRGEYLEAQRHVFEEWVLILLVV
jgi:hypothetical protein